MNYPLDVEICVDEFKKTERCNDISIDFLRAYVNVLNIIYSDGLNNAFPGAPAESALIKNHETEFRKCFREQYEEFLIQLKDAYKQGQIDSSKSANDIRLHESAAISSTQEYGGIYNV